MKVEICGIVISYLRPMLLINVTLSRSEYACEIMRRYLHAN
jgi:hypothetical protein